MKTLTVIRKEIAKGSSSAVQIVSLNRPEVHNAFNAEMIEELTQTFLGVSQDKSIRAVVLRGEGKSFCAGGDLNWMKSMAAFSYEENIKDSQALFSMFEAAAHCPVPVIGRVHGSVFGGGLGLVAICDIVAAARDTKFCFSEAKIGLAPAVISPFVLKKIQHSRGRQMMLTAQVFDEMQALEMGLIHFSGPEEEVDDFIQSQVDFISANGPEAVCAAKHLLDFVPSHSWSDVRSETTKTIAERRVSAEGQEGMKAFFEKRKPNWKK